VNLPICLLIKHYAMKMYGAMHIFNTLALFEGECSDKCSTHPTLLEKAACIHYTGSQLSL
jgi:hypothetical protein